MARGTGTSRCCPQLVRTCCRSRLRAATTMRFAWRRAPSPRKTCSETVPSTVARPTEPVLQHVGPPAARIDLNDGPVGDAWCANQQCWQQKPKESDQVIAGHGSLHRVYFSLLLHPWPSQRSRAGATVVSYQCQFEIYY